jgi:hypothetical protein
MNLEPRHNREYHGELADYTLVNGEKIRISVYRHFEKGFNAALDCLDSDGTEENEGDNFDTLAVLFADLLVSSAKNIMAGGKEEEYTRRADKPLRLAAAIVGLVSNNSAVWFQEFGLGFAVPAEVLQLTLDGFAKDLSFRNDACPSFGATEDGDQVLSLYCDHPDQNERERKEAKRFTVVSGIQGFDTFETDNVSDAVGIYLGKLAALLAESFVSRLKKILTVAQWEEMKHKNYLEQDHLICHSHDHCDANEVMIGAFEAFGLPISPASSKHTKLWNRAWELAKKKYLGGR